MHYNLYFGSDTLNIEMEGVLSFRDAHAFHCMLMNISKHENRGDIHINVKQLTKIDHTGLHLLMQAHDYAKKVHRVLTFIGPQGQVLDFLNKAAGYNHLHIAA